LVLPSKKRACLGKKGKGKGIASFEMAGNRSKEWYKTASAIPLYCMKGGEREDNFSHLKRGGEKESER